MNKKKNKDDIHYLIHNDEDFIHCPRLGNSVKKLIEKNPEGIGNERIAKVLLMDESEVEKTFNSAIVKLRKALGLD